MGANSPNERLFALGSFFENYRSSPHSCATFFLSIDYVLILTKMCWAEFWAIFFHKLVWSPCLRPQNVLRAVGCQSIFSEIRIFRQIQFLVRFDATSKGIRA
jgi:hypothetical protein